MSTASANPGVMTLTQVMERFGPDQMLETKIVELLAQQNGVVTDAGWIMGNLPTGHQSKVRVGLPQVFATSFNEHVPTSAGSVMTIQEASMKVEARSLLDEDEAELGGKGNADLNRAMEAYGFAESLNQFFAYNVFYGNPTTNAKLIKGLSSRYSSLEGGNAQNIIDGGGTASTNLSIWIVCWKPTGATMFYPLGATAGIFHQFEGVLPLTVPRCTVAYSRMTQWLPISTRVSSPRRGSGGILGLATDRLLHAELCVVAYSGPTIQDDMGPHHALGPYRDMFTDHGKGSHLGPLAYLCFFMDDRRWMDAKKSLFPTLSKIINYPRPCR